MAGKCCKTRSLQNVAEEDDLEFVSLSHVRELLKTQESTISAMFRAHMEATNKCINDILVKMNDIQQSLEFTQAEVQDLKRQLDDFSLNLVMYENVHGTVNFDTNRLASLRFNPMEYIQRAGKFNDLDPDSNFS